jgi:oligopeptide transport system substrate-binding protein
VLARNPNYYDASLVGLDELTFLPVVDGTTVLNLYKAGKAAMTASAGLSVLFNPVLSSKKDYHSSPAFATRFPYINTRRPPFDNVLLRYALNMATDKKAVADFYGADYLPARSLIAPKPGYLQPDRLEVDVEGRLYNVLSFDVEGARSLLAKAGYPRGMTEAGRRLEVPYHFPVIPDARPQGEILQQQWLHHLNVRVKLMTREFNVHLKMLKDGDYSGLAEDAIFPLFLDPYGFLKEFPNGAKSAAASAPDLVFSSEVEAANTIPNPAERMRRLAACETRLLKRMSFLPLFHEAYRFLCKPYVKGLGSQPLAETRAFRYAWIDTNWRPQ